MVNVADKWDSLIPVCDPAFLLRKIFTFMLNNDCVLNHGAAEVLNSDMLSIYNLNLMTDVEYVKVYKTMKTAQLEYTTALDMLNVSHIDTYFSCVSYSGVFMSILLFPLTSIYGDTSDIANF